MGMQAARRVVIAIVAGRPERKDENERILRYLEMSWDIFVGYLIGYNTDNQKMSLLDIIS